MFKKNLDFLVQLACFFTIHKSQREYYPSLGFNTYVASPYLYKTETVSKLDIYTVP